jgi:hypothetical protein
VNPYLVAILASVARLQRAGDLRGHNATLAEVAEVLHDIADQVAG